VCVCVCVEVFLFLRDVMCVQERRGKKLLVSFLLVSLCNLEEVDRGERKTMDAETSVCVCVCVCIVRRRNMTRPHRYIFIFHLSLSQ